MKDTGELALFRISGLGRAISIASNQLTLSPRQDLADRNHLIDSTLSPLSES